MGTQAFVPVPPLGPQLRRCRAAVLQMSTAAPDNPPATPQENHLSLDWRTFRACLVDAEATNAPIRHFGASRSAVWAHPIPRLEVGSTLIATSKHTWPASFAHLNRAVILVTDVSDTGISGLLLNRPTRYTVADHKSVLARVGPEFGSNTVSLGGDCSTGTLEMLHRLPPEICPGASVIVPGLSRGGFNAARKLVQSGLVSPDHFRFFVAYSRWTWEQFWAEMGRGAWTIASCSQELLLGEGAPDTLWSRVNDLL